MRLWVQRSQAGDDAAGCNGKVQRVVDGESYPFHNWQRLVELLQEMVSGTDKEPGGILPDISEK